MTDGVDTVQTLARLINRALARADAGGPAGPVPSPDPFHHLLYMQRRYPC